MRLSIDSINTSLGEAAIELLREGWEIRIEDISIYVDSPKVEVTAWSQWNLGNEPEGFELAACRVASRQFEELLARWEKLREAVGGAELEVGLAHDYGMGAVQLGKLSRDGRFIPTNSA